MDYSEIGKCIWCGKTKEETSFKNRPHTIPYSLGGNTIGFDICDKCNAYFGSDDKSVHPSLSIEVCVKEIFGMIRFMLQTELDENSYKSLKSRYFDYYHSRKVIRIRNSFSNTQPFIRAFTKQFKRGLYEIFLQEYHRVTKDGLNPFFDAIRRYARDGKGDLPVYYLMNNGIRLIEEDLSIPHIGMTDNQVKEVHNYGFYPFSLFGFDFYIEVSPKAHLCREVYISKICKDYGVGGFVNRGFIEMNRITDIPFFNPLQSYY